MLYRIIGQLRRLDVYSKPLEDVRIRTFSGGTVTLITSFIIVVLFLSELSSYLSTEVLEELYVDSSVGDERLKINFDVLFPSLACQFISVDALDVAGQLQSNISDTVVKETYRPDGSRAMSVAVDSLSPKNANKTSLVCGSCYGAESNTIRCCNTCEDVKMAYRLKGWNMDSIETVEQCKGDYWVQQLHSSAGFGCKIAGWLEVSKVAGNFHIAPGETVKEQHGHVHDLHALGPKSFNTSHVINHFSFDVDYPGKKYPLDGQQTFSDTGGVMAQYFLKIVPTVYVTVVGQRTVTHQFSVTKLLRQIELGTQSGMPGLFVSYEFSPLMVQLSEQQKKFSNFVAKVCAMVGGIFTVAGLLDSTLYRIHRSLLARQGKDR